MKNPWHNHTLARELDLGIAAVAEAGLLCRAVQDRIDPGALQKKDRSPVTVADFGSQALICRTLGEVFPDDPVIGEEDSAALREAGNETLAGWVVKHVTQHLPGHMAPDLDQVCAWIDRGNAKDYSPRFWTLDPIDGTKGFLRKQQYAISLALIIEGEIEAAIVGCPNLGESLTGDRGTGTLYAAIRGQGAWQLPLSGEGEPVRVHVSKQVDPTLIRFCESVEAAHSSHGDAARIAEHLAIAAEPARLDSQAKYAVVARGEAEAYLRLPRDAEYKEKIWDHAGGLLIVTEAGGKVTDIKGRELEFNHGHLLGKSMGVIVTNGLVHDAVIEAIRELGIGEF
ncbi:MAG: 3'(2'),5'-bisphosphate nucleotidase [Gemmatimonadales bacterium]|nr:3'(2'),5'-bisphosphate nucleotidase [Gemmatimonadales bacterium]